MIADRNDYKYVAGDLFARSAATNDYLVVIDGTSLHDRPWSLVRGEDVCWIWECINTRRAALFQGGDPNSSYGLPYQFKRVGSPPAAFGNKTVINNMVSAFNALLASRRNTTSSLNFTWVPTSFSQTIWHHQRSVPDAIFLLYINDFIVSMPQRYSYRHTPYDVWSTIADIESSMSTLKYCVREDCGSIGGDCDWSGFTTSATVSPVGGATPPTEAELENRYSRCIQAYQCIGNGDSDGNTDPRYWHANGSTTGTIKVTLPYVEHIKAVYPIYHIGSSSTYISYDQPGHRTISENASMASVVVSTTPHTMDANHVIEISPAQEIMQACPLSNLASEMNLQHGFSQDTPTNEYYLEISWYLYLSNISLIIELDESVSDMFT